MEHFGIDMQDSERFRLAIEATRDGIWECNFLTNQSFHSPRWCEIIGYSYDDPELPHTYNSWAERIHPDDYECMMKAVTDHLTINTPFDVEYRHRHKSGEYRWQRARGQAVFDESGKPVRMVGCISDITELKLAEELLQESMARYMRITNCLTNYQYEVRVENCLAVETRQSPSCEKVTGYRPEEFAGDPYLWINMVVPEDRDHVQHRVQMVLAGMDVPIIEHRITRKDGETRWVCDTIIPFRDASGNLISYDGVIKDITERKHTEETLVQAKNAAESANRAKSEFLANMSHELRTPMNGVIGMAELLKMTDLTEEQMRYVKALDLSGNNLLSLINDVLDLSKIEAGKICLEPTEFSLHLCIKNVMLMQKSLIHEKGLSLDLKIAKEIPSLLLGDQLRLKQILLNLLGNATKFTAQGGITISVQLLEQHDASVLVQIAVCDTGIGISAEVLDDIFKPFIQAESSTTRQFGGTGLGLTISRRLAELMNGSISVESTQGVGSCFNVTLPFLVARNDVTEDDSKDTTVVNWDEVPLRVLFVEDNPVNTKFGTTLLRKLGHDVVSVENGLECLVVLKNGTFDLVLMDIQMPVMNGEAALREIRRKEQGTSIRQMVIAVTAYALRGDNERFLQEGFDGYVSKPFKANELIFEMKRVIEKFKSPATTICGGTS